VLHLPPGSADLEIARLEMLSHPGVEVLLRERRPNGTWGRFHSRDSSLKSRFPTSEIAIRRDLALGLEKDNPVLEQAVKFLQKVLEGKAAWSDRLEKSEGWPIMFDAVTSGTLA
jgi:hypothetical protein